jgi:hypothetical protein
LGYGGPVFDPVAGCDYEPFVWEDVVAHSPIQYKLHTDVLDCRGCEVDLV